MDLQVVHLRINDAATKKPTPARVRLTDAAGRYYAPLGRLPNAEAIRRANPFHGGNALLDGQEWAYLDGAGEVLLPAGPLRVQMSKGPRYQAIDQIVERQAGKMALRFELKRHEELNKTLGDFIWADLFVRNLSPKAAALMGAAEGLDFVHLVAEKTDTGEQLLIDDYSGEAIAAECGGCQVQVGTYNHGGELGSLVLFNTHRMVHPLRLDQPGFEAYTLHDWCHQAHRKKGLVLAPITELEMIEVLPNLLLGEIDGLVATNSSAAGETSEIELAIKTLEFPCLSLPGSSRSRSQDSLDATGACFRHRHDEGGNRLSTAEAIVWYRRHFRDWDWGEPLSHGVRPQAEVLLAAELDRREARIPDLPMAAARRAALDQVFAEARAAVGKRAEELARKG